MLSIRTNVGATNAQRNLHGNQGALSKSMERLSSGFRINRAGDDAAGLAISEKLKAQVRGLNQAARNSLDGVSMLQTAEAGMDELQTMMQRTRELAVQGANGTLGSGERANIWNEINQLREEMTAIADRTKFNGQSLLNGALSTSLDGTNGLDVGLAVGGNAIISSVDVSGAKTNTGAVKTYNITASGNSITITDADDATRNQTIDLGAADLAANSTTKVEFSQLGISFTIQGSSSGATTTANAASAIEAVDIVTASGSGTASIQSGSNEDEKTSIAFKSVKLTAADASYTGISGLNTQLAAMNTAVGAGTLATTHFDDLIGKVDLALGDISTQRGALGALQNRLEHSIANVKAASENMAASNSRIRDVDVAEESASLARTNILMQAGVSVLAQANQMPQMALKLLG